MHAFPPVFELANAEIPSSTMVSTGIDGRWICRMTKMPHEGGISRVTAGVVDLVQAGDYLVGSSRSEGAADVAPLDALDPPVLGLDGSLFGAVHGDQVVLWVTEVFGQAMWVMEGSVTPSGIAGIAVHTSHAGGNAVRSEARFRMRRG